MAFTRRYRFLAILILACLSLPLPLQADTKGEIAAVLDYYAEIWNEGDLATLRGYYHPDFRLITSNGIVSLEQRLADLETVTVAGGDRGELRHGELEILPIGDKHALAYGSLRLRFRDGSSLDGWFSTLFVNTPFGWKALLTHN